MNEIMRELYYMTDTWADQQFRDDEAAKDLEEQKSALEDEIVRRIGEGGRELVESLSELSLKLETIHDEALFRASFSLGTEAAAPRRSFVDAAKASVPRPRAAAKIGGHASRPARAGRISAHLKAACP